MLNFRLLLILILSSSLLKASLCYTQDSVYSTFRDYAKKSVSIIHQAFQKPSILQCIEAAGMGSFGFHIAKLITKKNDTTNSNFLPYCCGSICFTASLVAQHYGYALQNMVPYIGLGLATCSTICGIYNYLMNKNYTKHNSYTKELHSKQSKDILLIGFKHKLRSGSLKKLTKIISQAPLSKKELNIAVNDIIIALDKTLENTQHFYDLELRQAIDMICTQTIALWEDETEMNALRAYYQEHNKKISQIARKASA